jgi:hypothetical protein
VRKDVLKSLIRALKSEGLIPSSLSFDAEGNLLNLQVQPLVRVEDAPAQPAPKPLTFRPVTAIGSLSKPLPVE